MLILRGTAPYCVQLQQKCRNTTHKSSRARFVRCGRACTCVAAISVNAVIEINVFDYNVHARPRACTSTRVHVRSVSEALE